LASDYEGPKTILRVARLLEALSTAPAAGEGLSSLTQRTGFGKATTHRLLTALVQIGFVEQDAASRRYRLGLAPFSIGAAAASRVSIIGMARASIDRLASLTGDTVFLTVRNNLDAVCVDRVSGGFPIKAQTQNIGDNTPLGASAGGLAILSCLADDEVRRITAANLPRLGRLLHFEASTLLDHVAATRSRGYALYDGQIVSGMTSIAMPIHDQRAEPTAAISVVAISERMSEERRQRILTALREEVSLIDQRVAPLASAHRGRR
jgi:DNA-binding IclR family transcriptional regulator